MVYLGIDLHRKRSHLVALDEAGSILLSRRIVNERANFQRIFGELEPGPIQVAFEATYGWPWLAELLADAGVERHMAHPLATKAIAAGRVKNDAVDARTLAHLLRAQVLPEAWIAPREVRERRRLVRMRASLVRIQSRLTAQVHAVLADFGILPEASDVCGVGGRLFLAGIELPNVPRGRIDANLRLVDALEPEIERAEAEIRELFRGDERIARLDAIPGIGMTIAATVLAEVGDPARFGSADALCSFAGLTPTERSSDAHVWRGHISKQGSRWLRWVMVEAAQRVREDRLLRFYEGIAARRGKKIARVALARRLLTLCYYALRDEQGCRAYPVCRSTSRRSVEARSPSVMASSGRPRH